VRRNEIPGEKTLDSNERRDELARKRKKEKEWTENPRNALILLPHFS